MFRLLGSKKEIKIPRAEKYPVIHLDVIISFKDIFGIIWEEREYFSGPYDKWIAVDESQDLDRGGWFEALPKAGAELSTANDDNRQQEG